MGVSLWHRGSGIVTAAAWTAAVVQVQSLAKELPHASDVAKKKKKKKKKKEKQCNKIPILDTWPWVPLYTLPLHFPHPGILFG